MNLIDELDRIAAKLIDGIDADDLPTRDELIADGIDSSPADYLAANILDDCDEWDEDQVTDDELAIIDANGDAIFELLAAKLNDLRKV
jgi:hypothetical protein